MSPDTPRLRYPMVVWEGGLKRGAAVAVRYAGASRSPDRLRRPGGFSAGRNERHSASKGACRPLL
jgi:hypothetical protein